MSEPLPVDERRAAEPWRRLLDLPDRLLNPDVLAAAGEEELRKTRFVQRTALVAIVVSLLAVVVHLAAGETNEAAIVGVVIALLGAILVALRLGLRSHHATSVVCAILVAGALQNSRPLGGVHGAPALLLILVPQLAVFMARARTGLLWLTVTTGALIWLTIDTPGDRILAREKLFAFVVLSTVLMGIGVVFERSHHRAKVELEQARDAAERNAAGSASFLANMSHEIRTPLGGVIGMADLLYKTELTDQQRECARVIRGSSRALLTIINDILDYSKIESGALTLTPRAVFVRDVFRDATELLRVSAEQKDIALKLAFAEDVPQYLQLDDGRLRQALINLIGNAIKFTSRGGVSVAVSVARKTGREVTLRVEVRDTGIGIPADRLDSIFEEFVQADHTTTQKYGGTGLGLAIARRLIELHGGALKVKSKVGVGTTFWFTLRATTANALDVGHTSSEEFDLNLPKGLRVLIAEDNRVNQLVLQRMLKKLDAEVTLVENGRLAVEAVRDGDFDIVLMDIHMPELDGFKATKRITEDPANAGLPVVMLTASVLDKDVRRGRAAGAVDFLAKPMTMGVLRIALAEHCGKPRG